MKILLKIILFLLLKKNAVNVFSHDPIMKAFIIKYANAFKWKWTDTENPLCVWDGRVNGNKLILYNFSRVPTGNKLFSKYLYLISYHELELIKNY